MCQGNRLYQIQDIIHKAFHLKHSAQNVQFYIKDNKEFLKKTASLPPLPDDIILCTTVVAGL